MKHRSWDEVGGEWSDVDPNWKPDGEEDDSEVTLTIESGIPGISMMEAGRFNGGRHVYLEYKANNRASARFEKAFGIAERVYDSGHSEQELAELVTRCGDLAYLRKRKKEYDAECKKADAEYETQKDAEETRWHASEWYDMDKLVKAALAAGWKRNTECRQRLKVQNLYYDIQPDDPATNCRLRLELHIDDSRSIHTDLWLHESVCTVNDACGGSNFGGWGMTQQNPYVQGIDFIDRWMGIPTPQQAAASLKQILTWNDHMKRGCRGYTL